MAPRKLFNSEALYSYVGSFGKFQLVLLVVFALNNIMTSFNQHGQEVIQYSPEVECALYKSQPAYNVLSDEFEKVKICSTCNTKADLARQGLLPSQHELICKDQKRIMLGKAFFFAGSVLGTVVLGYCGDKYGRVKALMASYILGLIGNSMGVLSSSAVFHSVCRFFVGCSFNASFLMIYVIIMEYTNTRNRTLILSVVMGTSYTFSGVLAPWLYVLTCNVKQYLLLVCFLQALLIMSLYLVPESYQLLAGNGRISKTIDSLKYVAKINGTELGRHVIYYLSNHAMIDLMRLQNYTSLKALYTSSNLRKKMALITTKAFCLAVCLGIMTKKFKMCGYSVVMNAVIIALSNLPASAITILIEVYGRCLASSIILVITSLYVSLTTLILSILGKSEGFVCAYLTLFSIVGIKAVKMIEIQHAGELLPVRVRSQGICLINLFNFFGFAVGSVASHMHQYLFDILAILLLLLSVLAPLILPETKDKRLPLMLKEAEEIATSKKLNIVDDKTGQPIRPEIFVVPSRYNSEDSLEKASKARDNDRSFSETGCSTSVDQLPLSVLSVQDLARLNSVKSAQENEDDDDDDDYDTDWED